MDETQTFVLHFGAVLPLLALPTKGLPRLSDETARVIDMPANNWREDEEKIRTAVMTNRHLIVNMRHGADAALRASKSL